MNTDKQFLTVAEVSKLFNISLQTVYRHVKKGKLSRDNNGLIALSECLRVYGAIPSGFQHDKPVNPVFNESDKQAGHDTITALNALITQLQADLSQSLKREQDYIEREKRLMALLEHQAGLKQNSGGFFSGLFKK